MALKAGAAATLHIWLSWLVCAWIVGMPADADAGPGDAAGGSAISASCAGCHGLHGEGNVAVQAPRLSGLPAAYLQRQLQSFVRGARSNPVMTPVAKALSAADIAALSAFYGRARAAAAAPLPSDAARNPLGKLLATRGRWNAAIPDCEQCHGSEGSGIGQSFPPLAGQSAAYIGGQMHAWKNHTRDPGPLGLMGGIAQKLSDRDVAAVAAYYGGSTADAPADLPDGGAARGSGLEHGGGFAPPEESTIPDDEYGRMLRLGERIFEDPRKFARAYVGNSLSCASCHLDAGRLADSGPLWAAYVSYPAYRTKNHRVITFEERLQDCFRFSMNGTAPPLGSTTLVALDAYAHWLATGAVIDPKLPGRGYPQIAAPGPPNAARGEALYAERCALCHGRDGAGQAAGDGKSGFPALWGPGSYNWGAGMTNISKAAAFVKANMPLSEPNTLSAGEAYDVAAYIDSQERPQDPRFTQSVARTRALFHDSPDSLYGLRVGGRLLGAGEPERARQANGSGR